MILITILSQVLHSDRTKGMSVNVFTSAEVISQECLSSPQSAGTIHLCCCFSHKHTEQQPLLF